MPRRIQVSVPDQIGEQIDKLKDKFFFGDREVLIMAVREAHERHVLGLGHGLPTALLPAAPAKPSKAQHEATIRAMSPDELHEHMIEIDMFPGEKGLEQLYRDDEGHEGQIIVGTFLRHSIRPIPGSNEPVYVQAYEYVPHQPGSKSERDVYKGFEQIIAWIRRQRKM